VNRSLKSFALDVPQRHIHGGDGGHGHRTAPPVSAAIEVLPDVLGLEWVAADKAGGKVIREIRGDRQFAAVESGVTQAVNALVSVELQGNEIPPRTADQHLGFRNLHAVVPDPPANSR